MPSDISFLEFASESEQDTGASTVFSDFLLYIANKKMRRYKHIIHTRGEKQGQSYYSHVMDLVTIAEKLRSPVKVEKHEMRCVLLALTIHDLNKIPPYGKRPDGREEKYADAASAENIKPELERLEVDAYWLKCCSSERDFFKKWHKLK